MWEALAEYARWTPSLHNVRPWQIRVRSETEADFLYMPARLLPVEDPLGRFLMIALGISIENRCRRPRQGANGRATAQRTFAARVHPRPLEP